MRTKELFAFMKERHAIYERRQAGKPKPFLGLADIFDGMLSCCRERSLGNKCVAKVYNNFQTYAVVDFFPLAAHHQTVFELIRSEWLEVQK